MNRTYPKKLLLIFSVIFVLPLFFSFPASAAPLPAQSIPLTLEVQIDQPDVFWNCMFLTPERDNAKPAIIKVEWNAGGISNQTKQAVLVMDSKSAGHLKILSEKDSLVTIDVIVFGEKNLKLGSTNMQIVNHGQTETVTIAPPARIEPAFTWGNE